MFPTPSLAPKRPRRLPDAPKRDEVEAIVDGLDRDGPLGLRDRALVELVYSAGLRSAEAVGLDLGDVDFEQETVHVRHGKGGKDRVVPLGEEAARLSRATSARRVPNLRAAPRTRSFSRCAVTGSTRPRCAGSSATPTACATRSRRTCSKAAPTCGRSRSCSATPRSRRRRCTATSTRSVSAAFTTTHTRGRRGLMRIRHRRGGVPGQARAAWRPQARPVAWSRTTSRHGAAPGAATPNHG